MTRPLILCIDDEQNILDLLSYNLQSAGFDTITATDGSTGLALAKARRPALVLLDLMLPDISGTEVCDQLKAFAPTVPIIMLTAKDSEADKVMGLELGADDYVIKPFSVRELTARVRAQLRRVAYSTEKTADVITVGRLRIDRGNYEAFRDGEKLPLTLKEFELLKVLAENQGKVLTRDFLLDHIWGYELYGETRTVDVHIRHLRVKLGDEAGAIETVRGVGYKLGATNRKM